MKQRLLLLAFAFFASAQVHADDVRVQCDFADNGQYRTLQTKLKMQDGGMNQGSITYTDALFLELMSEESQAGDRLSVKLIQDEVGELVEVYSGAATRIHFGFVINGRKISIECRLLE